MHQFHKGILLIAIGIFIGLYVLLEIPSPVYLPATFPDYGAVFLKYGGYLLSCLVALIGLYLAASSPPQA